MALSYRQKEGNLTILGTETEFNGVLTCSDNLVITGSFSGTIQSSGSLVVEKTGKCIVDSADADSITIAGTVEGALSARDKIEMYSGSKVTGDIKTSSLRIADNVVFHGNVTMLDEVTDFDIFAVSPTEYKKMVAKRAIVEVEDEETE